jgi:CheY-like chemotaxis protein
MPERAIILLVEDSEDDIVLMKKAFESAGITNPLFVVRNGEEAVFYLCGEGKYSNRAEYPVPDLVLLDLKMPIMDGFEFLEWLRRQPSICTLRVIVLSSSDAIQDINRAYQLGANSFLLKPGDFENFTEISQLLHKYWLYTDKVPETGRPAVRQNPAGM